MSGKKKKSETFPVWVAHMDTVFPIKAKSPILGYTTNGQMVGLEEDRKTRRGIGADDKCGIYAAMCLLDLIPESAAAFFVDEEIGCVGSKAADLSFFKGASFILQADRQGFGDAIYKYGGCRMASEEFVEASKEVLLGFGIKPAVGHSFTDVRALTEIGVGVSCFNFECGYYGPHSDHEAIDLVEFDTCIEAMYQMGLKLGDRTWPHKYEEEKYTYTGSDYYRGGNWVGGGSAFTHDRKCMWTEPNSKFLKYRGEIVTEDELQIGDYYNNLSKTDGVGPYTSTRFVWNGKDFVEASYMEEDNILVYTTIWFESWHHLTKAERKKYGLVTMTLKEFRESYDDFFGMDGEGALVKSMTRGKKQIPLVTPKASPPKGKSLKEVKKAVFGQFDRITMHRYHRVGRFIGGKDIFGCEACVVLGEPCRECKFAWAIVTEELTRKASWEDINLLTTPQVSALPQRLVETVTPPPLVVQEGDQSDR